MQHPPHRPAPAPPRRARPRHRRSADERGDVPGWVLVTIMTISIGMAIWTMARPQLVGMLESALGSVQ